MTDHMKHDTIEDILNGVYARAADNNGNSEYLSEGYADYSVEEAKQALASLIEREIIGEDEPQYQWGDGTAKSLWYEAQFKLRAEQRKALEKIMGDKTE